MSLFVQYSTSPLRATTITSEAAESQSENMVGGAAVMDDSSDEGLGDEQPFVERTSDDPNAIPWKVVGALALLQVVEAFNANSLFAYLPYMVVDFGLVPSIDKAGVWSGFLGAAFYGGQFLSSFAWGVLSDRFGKRRILLFGSLGTLVTVLAFGFSVAFWMALSVRFLGGLLNGNIGVAKAMLGQVATKETQPKLFGIFGMSWAAGAIVAGAYGGLLARVAVKWPETFGGTIFERFPYLLPNLVTAAVSVLALALAWFFLFDPPRPAGGARRPKLSAVFRNREALLATATYSLLGGSYTMLDELLPLWLMTEPFKGGLGFGTSLTGQVNMVTGTMNLLVLLLIYVPVARRLGVLETYRLGHLIGMPVVALLFPLLSHITSPVGQWFYIALCCFGLALAGQFTFSSVFALVANSVHPDSMGAVNGWGQMLVAFFRMLAPMVAGPLYYWSVNPVTGLRSFPFNYALVFWVVAGCWAALFATSYLFPLSLDAPKPTEEIELSDVS